MLIAPRRVAAIGQEGTVVKNVVWLVSIVRLRIRFGDIWTARGPVFTLTPNIGV